MERNTINEQVLDLFNSGKSLKDILKETRLSRKSIIEILNNSDIGTTEVIDKQSNEIDTDAYKEYLKSGMKIEEISRKMLMSTPKFVKALRIHGVEITPEIRDDLKVSRLEVESSMTHALSLGKIDVTSENYYGLCDSGLTLKGISREFGLREKELLYIIIDRKWYTPNEYRKGLRRVEKDSNFKRIANNYVEKFEILINRQTDTEKEENLKDIANLMGVSSIPKLRQALRRSGYPEYKIKEYLYGNMEW